MKKFNFAVIIGRFQPFHKGHLCLVEHASRIAEHIIIIVGSHNAPRSIRNPFNTQEREKFIRDSLKARGIGEVTIIPLSDSAYNFTDWVMRVQQKISVIVSEGTITIVGHFKDDTSFYLNYFPQWHLDKVTMQADGISATQIRNAVFENRIIDVAEYLPEAVSEKIGKWTTESAFAKLQEEYQYIKSYRKKWESAPYPPLFVTADAVVIGLGHVLLVKRKGNPGKGCFALPGGFVNQSESIERACLRELKEETKINIGYKELQGSIKLTHVFDQPFRDPRGRVVSHAFMFELNVKELPEITAGDDAGEAFWLPLYKIEQHESDFFNDHAQIVKYFINHAL